MVATCFRSDRDLRWLLSVAPSWISQGISCESIVGQSRDRVYLAGGAGRDVGGRVCVFAAIKTRVDSEVSLLPRIGRTLLLESKRRVLPVGRNRSVGGV